MGIIDRIERFEQRLPDSRTFFETWFKTPRNQFLLFLCVAVLLRIATFGDPTVSIDEDFYFLVGQRMHLGDIPYVDVWDRKPLGLFLLYYLFAGISNSVLAYQIPAAIFASATASVICRIAMKWAGAQGSVVAGLCYLILLNPFLGDGGQSPVFYNLLVASAAYVIFSRLKDLEAGRFPAAIWLAMAVLGVALTLKQTTFFESVFFGLTISWVAIRARCPKLWARIPAMMLLGALPTVLISLWYYHAGYWPEYWHAMVKSNLLKQNDSGQYILRIVSQLARTWPLIVMICFVGASGASSDQPRSSYGMMFGWLFAAIVGYFAVPNIYLHYVLPLLVPMTLISARELNRRTIGIYWLVVVLFWSLSFSSTFDFSVHTKNRRAMNELAAAIHAHDPRGTVLLYESPPLLLSMSKGRALTPLLFPLHFSQLAEKDVSHIATDPEFDRVIAARPGAVAVSQQVWMTHYSKRNRKILREYVNRHCHLVEKRRVSLNGFLADIMIFGDCFRDRK